MINGSYINILCVDLETSTFEFIKRTDLCEYLGGVGVATKLLEENLIPNLDAFEPSQPIIFSIGPLNNIFPVVTKTVAMFKSPLTGELGESYAGGRFALGMFMAGIDAIIIKGKAKKPVYLSIFNNHIDIRDARSLWGASDEECVRAIRDNEPGPGKRSIIRIGKAGENLVKYAGVNVDTYRHFGRLGLGAVFGSKNLKAIFISGDTDRPIENQKEYFKTFQSIYKKVTETELMDKYHELGTSININILNKAGGLPTKNLTQNSFEHADSISGETFAKDYLIRKMACVGCPVGCIHIGETKREFDKGYEYETINVSYDHEPIYAVGAFLGIKSAEEVILLINAVEKFGLDVMSTGVILGWATEAFNNGLIGLEHTLVPLSFGDTENYITAIEHISNRKNDFYRTLGEGLRASSQTFGGEDYAMLLGGHEMAGYHTGYGMLLGQSMGSRHSHLCNAGYSFDQAKKEYTPEELVEEIISEEIERCILNSLCICLFARKIYDRETVITALNSLGINFSNQQLTKLGLKIYSLKQRIKQSMGFDYSAITFPKRFFETDSLNGKLDQNQMYKLKELYIKRINEVISHED